MNEAPLEVFHLSSVIEYKKRRQKRLDEKAVYDYRERREQRWIARMDAEDDEGNEGNKAPSKGGHGNTRIPFGLGQREGIEVDPDWTPRDAWEALAGKGYSAGDVYRELRTTGKIEKRTPKEPEKPKLDKKAAAAAVKNYEASRRSLTKLEREKKNIEKELKKADADMRAARWDRDYSERLYQQFLLKTSKEELATPDGAAREKALEAERDKAAEEFNKYEKAYNEIKGRRDKADEDISKAKGEISEREGLYRQAMMETPEYPKVMECRGYEEKIRRLSDTVKSNDAAIEKNKSIMSSHQKLIERCQSRLMLPKKERYETDEYLIKTIQQHKDRVESVANTIKKLEAESAPAKKQLAEYEKKLSETRGEGKDWDRVSRFAEEDSWVKEADFDKLSGEAVDMMVSGVAYKKIRKYIEPPTEREIVQYVAGGDETGGSCASAAFAYLANRKGYEVLDFRGGASRRKMASECTRIVGRLGATEERDSNDLAACNRLFAKMEPGKEYWFATASHAAVIRKNGDNIEYLELQSSMNNGWFPLNDRTLQDRFKARRSHSSYGSTYKATSTMIDADKLFENPEFITFLGYINTEDGKQKKGSAGSVK